MTDRLKGVVVAFDKDLRDDDAEPILAARMRCELARKFTNFCQIELLGLKPFKE